jgi:DnaJ-class molecular chaperone
MHPHAVFTRRGDDLEIELHISLLEALVGFTRNVTHLDDRVLSLHRAEIVSPSTLWRLRGQGMPVRNVTGTFGDLLVRFVVEYPTALTADEKQRVHTLLP